MNKTLDQTLEDLRNQHGAMEVTCALFDCLTARKESLISSNPAFNDRRQVNAEVSEIDQILSGLSDIVGA